MWIYTPSAFTPGSADSTLDYDSLCRGLAQYATWNGKLRSVQSWRRVCKVMIWKQRLFGQTLKPSITEHGVTSWISLLRDSRANLLLSQGKVEVREIRADYGPTSLEYVLTVGQQPCSSRMYPAYLQLDTDESGEEFVQTSPSSDTTFDTAYLDLTEYESGSSSWLSEVILALRQERCLTSVKLSGARRSNWVTPLTDEMRRNTKRSYRLINSFRSGSSCAKAIRLWWVLFRHARQTCKPGLESKLLDQAFFQPLNSQFVEWLMGLPLGWTNPILSSKPSDYQRWVTQSSRSLQRMLGPSY